MNLRELNSGSPATKQWLKPVFGSVNTGESVYLHEDTPTVFPPAGSSKLYVKNDNKVYTIDSAGVERIVGDEVGDLTDLENKTQNIDLVGTVSGTTQLNGNLNMTSGDIQCSGNVNIGGTINGLSPPGGVFAQISNVVVANTTAETTIIGTIIGSTSVPANEFKVGGSYILDGGGVMNCLNNANLTLRIYGGSTGTTLLGTIPTITIPTSTGKWWGISCYFTVRSLGGAGVAVVSTRAVYQQNVDSQNGLIGQSFHTINNTTFDTTDINTLNITVQWGSASPSNSLTCAQLTLFESF